MLRCCTKLRFFISPDFVSFSIIIICFHFSINKKKRSELWIKSEILYRFLEVLERFTEGRTSFTKKAPSVTISLRVILLKDEMRELLCRAYIIKISRNVNVANIELVARM